MTLAFSQVSVTIFLQFWLLFSCESISRSWGARAIWPHRLSVRTSGFSAEGWSPVLKIYEGDWPNIIKGRQSPFSILCHLSWDTMRHIVRRHWHENEKSSLKGIVSKRKRFLKESSHKYGPIVYRLGHQVFILVRGVRLPLGLLITKKPPLFWVVVF